MTKLYLKHFGEEIVPTDFTAGKNTIKIYLKCENGTGVSIGEIFGSFRDGSATLCCDTLTDGEYALLIHTGAKSTPAAKLTVGAGLIGLPTDTDDYLRLMRTAVDCRRRCDELEMRISRLEKSVYETYLF